jgi:hypothetical protein
VGWPVAVVEGEKLYVGACVADPVWLGLPVGVAAPETLPDGELEGVTVRDDEEVSDAERVCEGVAAGELEDVAVPLALCVSLGEADAVGVNVALGEAVCDGLWLGVTVSLGEPDPEGESDPEGVWVCVGDSEGVSVTLGVCVAVPLGDADPEGVRLGEGVLEPLGDCVWLGLAVPLGVPVGEGLRVTDWLRVCVGVGAQPSLRPTSTMPGHVTSTAHVSPASVETSGARGSAKPRAGRPTGSPL